MVAPSSKGARRDEAEADLDRRAPARGRSGAKAKASGGADAKAASGARAKPRPQLDAPQKRRVNTPFLTFTLIALALAVALVGVGIGGYYAANLLGSAVRAAARQGAETPSALAGTVCADFLQQNYDDLMARIDPDPAPPAATGAFNASATAKRLRAIDQRDGPVSSCTPTRLDKTQTTAQSAPDGATRLLLVMWRVGEPTASVLITRQDADGAWRVERDSAFLLAT